MYVRKTKYVYRFYEYVNPFMCNVEKWSDILKQSLDVNTTIVLKYVWPFFNIMHERIKRKRDFYIDDCITQFVIF